MNDMAPCPIPDVQEALRPYIHPRQETTRIRRTLGASLPINASTAHPLTLTSTDALPAVSRTGSAPPEAFTGVRRLYIKALQAHQAAQQKLSRLRAELDALQHTSQAPHAVEHDSSAARDRVAHLRQQRRLQKLKLIDAAFGDVASSAQAQASDSPPLEHLVQSYSNVPVPPLASSQLQGPDAELELRLLGLKKAVLVAHAATETETSLPAAQTNGSSPTGYGDGEQAGRNRVIAVQAARDELITWIETELAKIPEDGGDAETEQDQGLVMSNTPSDEGGLDAVAALYARYIVARRALVDAIQTTPSATASTPPSSDTNAHSSAPQTPDPPSTSSTLLPYLQSLHTLSSHEAALLQQSAYLRRQLSTASQETQALILRLAEESHLVAPGTQGTGRWLEAARKARERLREVVERRVREGDGELGGARDVLGRLGK